MVGQQKQRWRPVRLGRKKMDFAFVKFRFRNKIFWNVGDKEFRKPINQVGDMTEDLSNMLSISLLFERHGEEMSKMFKELLTKYMNGACDGGAMNFWLMDPEDRPEDRPEDYLNEAGACDGGMFNTFVDDSSFRRPLDEIQKRDLNAWFAKAINDSEYEREEVIHTMVFSSIRKKYNIGYIVNDTFYNNVTKINKASKSDLLLMLGDKDMERFRDFIAERLKY
jgi:hypothetical protein